MLSILVLLVFFCLLADMAEASPFAQEGFWLAPTGSVYPDPENLLCIACAIGEFCQQHSLMVASAPSPNLNVYDVIANLPNLPGYPQDDPQYINGFEVDYFAQGPSTLYMPAPQAPTPYFHAPTLPASPTPSVPAPPTVDNVEQLDEDAATDNQLDVSDWNQNTYTVGDRLSPPQPVVSPKARRQRRPRKATTFRCSHSDCSGRKDSVFDRHCDLARHEKIRHGDRPYACSECDQSFLYPKDLRRHLATHTKEIQWTCLVSDCSYARKGFSRRDNFMRHMRNKHPEVNVPTVSSLSP